MTQLLEKVLIEVYKLPPEKQDAIATIILEELEDERRWDKAFAESQDQLAQLAQNCVLILRQDGSKKWKGTNKMPNFSELEKILLR
ncbi:hypothetical protein J4G08_17655 [Candidatus Poribacteria bacterium]|nr:hypothetical protein [Candidatus Poribacteria bacterium]